MCSVAAMVMAYRARPATRDIDAVFVPDTEVMDAAGEVARERGWPRSWLNNQASSYVNRLPDRGRNLVLEAPGIRCMAASPEHLLAMKVMAARRIQDADDIGFLIERLGLRRSKDVLKVVADVFPDEPVSEHARLLIDDILARSAGGAATPAP
jgi:predicted nucleotidyltransferase